MMDDRALELLDAWWEIGEEGWYSQSDETDAMLKDRFGDMVEAARAGKLDHWQDAPHTTLALLLLLDQLPRNIFRGTPEAFSSDAQAMKVADAARAKGSTKPITALPAAFSTCPTCIARTWRRKTPAAISSGRLAIRTATITRWCIWMRSGALAASRTATQSSGASPRPRKKSI
jgi:uncharacterized protein (DUF924 family)